MFELSLLETALVFFVEEEFWVLNNFESLVSPWNFFRRRTSLALFLLDDEVFMVFMASLDLSRSE